VPGAEREGLEAIQPLGYVSTTLDPTLGQKDTSSRERLRHDACVTDIVTEAQVKAVQAAHVR
jgi:hypothetical protein